MADLAHARTVPDGAGQKPDTDSIKKGVGKVDLQAGQSIAELDQAEVFLQQHGILRSQLSSLLDADNGKAERRLRKRVDMILLPLLCGTYTMQYLDKQALGCAAVFDLFPSAGWTSEENSWMASIFYLAYLVSEWPSSYLAQKLPTGKIISAFVFCCGSVMLITVACENFAGWRPVASSWAHPSPSSRPRSCSSLPSGISVRSSPHVPGPSSLSRM
jgi:hypothetical protein